MTPKQLIERKSRIAKLNRALAKLFPRAAIELTFGSPWELLVAVELSAQCTDKRVNAATAKLFKKYKTLDAYVRAASTAAGVRAFEEMIRPCGYYHAKAKNILGAAAMVQRKFGGAVPKTLPELLELPGVARKTATVVLSTAYGITAGITVDTHVIRFTQRFDLSDYTDPVRIERDLVALLPKKEWARFSNRVIFYGRYLAPARHYDTSGDPLVKLYPPAGERFRTVR